VTGDLVVVFAVKDFIIAVFLFVRNRGDKIVEQVDITFIVIGTKQQWPLQNECIEHQILYWSNSSKKSHSGGLIIWDFGGKRMPKVQVQYVMESLMSQVKYASPKYIGQ
jgi:hypothetical protein